MLNCQLTRGELFVKDGSESGHEISGIIGLSGRAKGTVVLSMDEKVAISATEAFVGESADHVDDDVVDAVGELTNMIAGGAKAHLEHFAMSVTLPSVVTGKGHSIEFPKEVTPVCIPFESKWGEIVVEVGLVEQPAEVAAGVQS